MCMTVYCRCVGEWPQCVHVSECICDHLSHQLVYSSDWHGNPSGRHCRHHSSVCYCYVDNKLETLYLLMYCI